MPDPDANGCTPIDDCVRAGTCPAIDECASGACGPRALRCTDLPRGYQCECEAGHGAPPTGGRCEPIDECALDDPCVPGTCTNTAAGYECACPPGLVVADGRCADVDECASSPCGAGLCTQSTLGTYVCTRCPTGFTAPAVGGTCADLDECAMAGVCDPAASCTNLPGSFSCRCNPGYEGPGSVCSDIDECLPNVPDECGPDSTCVNTQGAYQCLCGEGFVRVGTACVDVDECASGALLCPRDEVCVNRRGTSAACVCRPGFQRPRPDAACAPSCGDGARGPGEECDDANTASGDGCSAHCEVEHGFACFETRGAPSVCEATCGDGVVHPAAGEECDDGAANDDATPDACRVRCVRAHCGDGVLDSGERCDDGPANSAQEPDACRPDGCRPAFCGDGVVDRTEQCDPGGDVELDGARCADCTVDGGVAVDGGAAPASSGCRVGGGTDPSLVWIVLVAVVVIGRRRRMVASCNH